MPSPTLYDAGSGIETKNTNTHNISLPSNLAGQLLLVIIGFDGTVSSSLNTGGPWTKLQEVTTTGQNTLTVFAKVADGTTDSGITGSLASDNSEQSTHRSLAIQTWEGTIGGGVNIQSTTGTSANPDPPAANDAWGNVDRKTIAVQSADAGRATTAFPTLYTLNQFSDDGGPSNVGLSSCGLNQLATGSQNPSVFTIETSDEWVATTISIRGTVGAPEPQTFFVPFLHDDLWLYNL